MREWLLQHALSLALPIIAGALAYIITQWLKAWLVAVDKASPLVKQGIALAASFAMVTLAKLAGAALPGVCIIGDDGMACLQALTQGDAMKTLISYLIAVAIHTGKKQAEASASRGGRSAAR